MTNTSGEGVGLYFPRGLVGYPGWRHFRLGWLQEDDPVAVLQSNDEADVWFYAWLSGDPQAFVRDVTLAHGLGARHMLLWEADYIDGVADKETVQRVMRSHAEPAP